MKDANRSTRKHAGVEIGIEAASLAALRLLPGQMLCHYW
jgi:hypothetical protein